MSEEAKARAAKRRKERRAKPLAVADLDKLRSAVNQLSAVVHAQEQRLVLVHLELQTLRTACVITPLSLPALLRECLHRVSPKELESLGWTATAAAAAQKASRS